MIPENITLPFWGSRVRNAHITDVFLVTLRKNAMRTQAASYCVLFVGDARILP